MSVAQDNLFSIAVLPYLKTSGSVQIGAYKFRSTDDRNGLSENQAIAVSEISEMLYVQNDSRVRSASYAVLPQAHEFGFLQIPDTLKQLQSLVAYLYGKPNGEFGGPFLNFECATLLLFTPGLVTKFLVDPEHHTISDTPLNVDWENDRAQGYDGLLNFKVPFWVVKGSRVYPPLPHITLNQSQDLAIDWKQFLEARSGNELARLLSNDEQHIGERIFTAIGWYNSTSRAGLSEGEALINLAIAFESLLELPTSEKTDRFVDSVSLLLGRVPRLNDWVRQFYDARSRVAHEGKLSQGRFLVQRSGKSSLPLVYHPLLVFGREIFHLCVAAITHGAYLAEAAGIAAKLKTNTERIEELSRILDAEPISDVKQQIKLSGLIAQIERFRFVSESGLSVAIIMGAVQRAVQRLIALNSPLRLMDKVSLAKLAAAGTKDEFVALEALSEVHSQLALSSSDIGEPERTVWSLLDVAWAYTFQTYFQLRRSRDGREQH